MVAAALCSGAVTLLILAFLVSESWPLLREVGPVRLIGDASWHPRSGSYGLLPMLLGSLAVTATSLIVTVPLGVGSALFLHYWSPRAIAAPYRAVIALLAGIPSVVYGLWGLVVLVPIIARIEPPGQSLLAGTIVLSLMTLPTIAFAADAAIAQVAPDLLRGAVALGLSRGAVIRRIVLPASTPGIATGVLLQAGRALGETMAVLMVCGNVVQMPSGIFAPVRTLTANIALEMGYAVGQHRSALFASGLLLLLLVAALVIAAELLERRQIGHA